MCCTALTYIQSIATIVLYFQHLVRCRFLFGGHSEPFDSAQGTADCPNTLEFSMVLNVMIHYIQSFLTFQSECLGVPPVFASYIFPSKQHLKLHFQSLAVLLYWLFHFLLFICSFQSSTQSCLVLPRLTFCKIKLTQAEKDFLFALLAIVE